MEVRVGIHRVAVVNEVINSYGTAGWQDSKLSQLTPYNGIFNTGTKARPLNFYIAKYNIAHKALQYDTEIHEQKGTNTHVSGIQDWQIYINYQVTYIDFMVYFTL